MLSKIKNKNLLVHKEVKIKTRKSLIKTSISLKIKEDHDSRVPRLSDTRYSSRVPRLSDTRYSAIRVPRLSDTHYSAKGTKGI